MYHGIVSPHKELRMRCAFAAALTDGNSCVVVRGQEAVLSRDNGRTWDWDRRFILYRWAMCPCTARRPSN